MPYKSYFQIQTHSEMLYFLSVQAMILLFVLTEHQFPVLTQAKFEPCMSPRTF